MAKEKGGAKGEGKVPEMIRLASMHGESLSARGKVERGLEAVARLDADLEGNPVLFVGLLADDADDYVAQRDIPAEQALDQLIGERAIPGGAVRPEHREAILAALEGWGAAIERAKERARALPDFRTGKPEGEGSGKPKAKAKAKR